MDDLRAADMLDFLRALTFFLFHLNVRSRHPQNFDLDNLLFFRFISSDRDLMAYEVQTGFQSLAAEVQEWGR